MATFSSKATGLWDATGQTTWNEDNYPVSGDTVTIQNGHVISIKGSEASGSITINAGGTLRFDGDTDSVPSILSLDNGATIANSGAIDSTGTGSTGYASIVGTSLEQITGSDVDWGTGYWHIAQLDLVPATTTGGAGCTIIIDDDVRFSGGFTLTAGDTASCTVPDTNIDNGDSWINSNGTLTLTGTAGHNITITKDVGGWNTISVLGTVSLQYVTITGYIVTVGGGTTIPNHTIDNVSITNTLGYAIYAYGTSQPVIATNCTFSGQDGETWVDKDVAVKTGGSAILENCTYTTLGMNATGATWIIDKTGNDFTIYGNLASSETPPAGYRAADITGNLRLSLATTYGTPFDTSYTLGADCTGINDLTIDTNTALDAATYSVGVSGNISNSGTFTPGSSVFTMNGTSQSLTGSWTFWSFTKSVESADTLTFDNTATYTFGGNVTLNGAEGQLLSIISDSAGNAFDFVLSAGAVKTNLSYLSVKDSDASGSHVSFKPINPTYSVDVSGNTSWFSVAGGQKSIIYNYYY